MSKITGKLRWYPGDPLVEIKRDDLEKIGQKYGVSLSVEEVRGKDFITEGEVVREETMNSSLEEVTQTVVTISADNEKAFREAVRQLIHSYRAPRAPYSTWGSDEWAKGIVADLADECDGWL